MSEHPITDAHDEAYTQVSYQELAGRFEADNARLAAQLATTTEKIEYSDKGVFDALLRDNARLAAELADFKRTEPLKVDERNQWRDKAKKLEAVLAEKERLESVYNKIAREAIDTVAHLWSDGDRPGLLRICERLLEREKELADARDALKAVWPFIQEDEGMNWIIPSYQAVLDKIKEKVSK